MKKTFNAILLLPLLCVAASCDDFLTREPVNKFSAETYFSSEAELEMHANGMLNSYLPDYSEPASGDAYNDLIATKTSTDFFRADIEWDADRQGSWSWGFLRKVNFMINNMSRCKDAVSEEIYNHYMGVARFWRAYNYVSRIRTFSDVPWVEKVPEVTDTTILYGGRDDREYVFHKVTEDLLYASENCMNDKFRTDGRVIICKDIVNALASRFFLYEATFRKNIGTNPATGKAWTNGYETVEDLLGYARDCAKAVIEVGGYSLVDDWQSLFISESLQSEEVIWGRSYVADVNGRHNLTRYFHSSTLGQQYSGTKDLVRMFLKADGTPIGDDGARQSITTEFEGRDPRLGATVLGPGREIKDAAGATTNETIDFTWCKTGYQIVKWSIPDATHFQNSIDENSLPILRYPEVLLNYAEACNELGEMTEAIWKETVGAIRERAGVRDIYPLSADYVADTWLRSYYSDGLAHPAELDDIALEIRRERVTELTFESGLRQADVYRYGQADLIARRYEDDGWAGIYVTAAEAGGKMTFEGVEYTFESAFSGALNTTTCYPIKEASEAVESDWYLSEGDHGYLVYKYPLKWEERKYCRPIPTSALNKNKNLGQNYGW